MSTAAQFCIQDVPLQSVVSHADLQACRSGSVLGAWNAIAHELVSVPNTTVINTETMYEFLCKIATSGLTGLITLLLDNARTHRFENVFLLAA
ncbi:MAG: hypothetical protein SH868_08140 [Bythopirellula sp.]|nr:hypothetical protein [Bythopirellula sp.]